MLKLVVVVPLVLLLALSVVLAKRCFDDAKLCPSGELLFREAVRGCKFASCTTIDAQVADGGCDATGSPCANGDIVYRDPGNQCAFAACPSAVSSAPSLPSDSSAPIDSPVGGGGSGGGCPRDALACAGCFFVRRNAALGCAFDACPALLQGNPCPADTKHCAGSGVVVRRNPQNRCLFDACPP